MLKALLEGGASPNGSANTTAFPEGDGATPLYEATYHQWLEVVHALLEHNACTDFNQLFVRIDQN